MMYILLFVIALILFFYKFCVTKPPPNFPPGPRFNVPIINTNVVEAYNLLIGKDEIEKHKEYRKKYGDTYAIMVAGIYLIYVSSYKHQKDAFDKEATNFRPEGNEDFHNTFADFKGGDGRGGIIFAGTKVWKEQRRFAT